MESFPPLPAEPEKPDDSSESGHVYDRFQTLDPYNKLIFAQIFQVSGYQSAWKRLGDNQIHNLSNWVQTQGIFDNYHLLLDQLIQASATAQNLLDQIDRADTVGLYPDPSLEHLTQERQRLDDQITELLSRDIPSALADISDQIINFAQKSGWIDMDSNHQ